LRETGADARVISLAPGEAGPLRGKFENCLIIAKFALNYF
jgi:hypothetical protein